ncbi:MAG TPA: hypothetical protein VMG08_09290 [Allosphingosinicella sp.]|nr:hypothetical protein [Allosphingosinicella sp.]
MARILAFLIALVLAGATPAQAEWRRAESANFVVYGNMSEATLRSRVLLLEDFDRLLRALTSADEPDNLNKFHIYITDGPESLRSVRSFRQGVAGFYTATPDGIAAFVDGREDREGNHVLFHEYVHHFMTANTSNSFPTWYSEGFAEYFATVRFGARRIDIGNFDRGRAYTLEEMQWLPMDRILAGGMGGLTSAQVSQFYAQSWLLTHYFLSNGERQQALRRLLAAQRRLSDPAQALMVAMSMTPQQLNDELRRYIRGGSIAYRQMERASNATPPRVTITTLPASAADMILVEGALRIGIPDENRQPTLLRVRAAAARYPGDPLAARVLAHLELLYGDPAAADRLLDPLIQAQPRNAELLYLKGLRWLTAANSDNPPEGAEAQARQWLERARAADDTHFQTLYRLAESRRGDDDYVSESTGELLTRAHRLAPQVPNVTFNAASMLISLRRYDEAIAILRPLALSPHEEGLSQAALQLMGQAAARRDGVRGGGRRGESEDAPAEGEATEKE